MQDPIAYAANGKPPNVIDPNDLSSLGPTTDGLHCFAFGSLALGSKLFSGLAVQTLGVCLLGAGLGNCFLVGLAHFSH